MSYSPELLALAAQHGIAESELARRTNGCSGGLSWAYRIVFGRAPSCEDACHIHDLLYSLGDRAGTRKEADLRLRRDAARAGKAVPGWLEKMREQFPKTAWIYVWLPPVRRFWRIVRAWIMYAAVRVFGGSHWKRG